MSRLKSSTGRRVATPSYEQKEHNFIYRVGTLIVAIAVMSMLFLAVAIHDGYDGWWLFGLGAAVIIYAVVVPFRTKRMLPAVAGALLFSLVLLVLYRWLWVWTADLFSVVAGTNGNEGFRLWLIDNVNVLIRALFGALAGLSIGRLAGKTKAAAGLGALLGAFLLIFPLWLTVIGILVSAAVLLVTWAILLWRRDTGWYVFVLPVVAGLFTVGYVGLGYVQANPFLEA